MPNFYVNNVLMSSTEGAATVPAPSNTFLLSWDGLRIHDESYRDQFNVFLSAITLSVFEGSSARLYYYLSEKDVPSPGSYEDQLFGGPYIVVGTSGSTYIDAASSIIGKTLRISGQNPILDDFTYYITFTAPAPTITAQPSITSINPASGSSTTISWSAATVSNQGSSSVYYQYFVGPTSKYSDSYHIGTTQSTSAVIPEEKIIEKCGSGFGTASGSTCYLYVRAY